MNQIQPNIPNAVLQQNNYRRPSAPVIPFPIKNIQSESNLNSQVYINISVTNKTLMSAELASRNINDATSLIQSIEENAALIENKLGDMKALAIQGGCACKALRKIQESIKDVSNNFLWNGKNFMEGGGENNQKTTALNMTIATGGETKENLQLSFKSFNPLSAVDTNGSLEPTIPNLPDLNKSSGTDTHAYGDAALYSKLNKDAYLHIHTKAMREQAVIQIDRAIDGIQSERERLAGYLKQLKNLSENNQDNALSKNEYMSQKIGIKQADQLAVYLKNEILISPVNANLTQINISPNALSRLLN